MLLLNESGNYTASWLFEVWNAFAAEVIIDYNGIWIKVLIIYIYSSRVPAYNEQMTLPCLTKGIPVRNATGQLYVRDAHNGIWKINAIFWTDNGFWLIDMVVIVKV